MQINSKVEDTETLSDTKQVIETPKSAPINFKRAKFEKRFSLIEDPNHPPKLWKQSSSSLSRDRSPSHKIPNASRFFSKREEDIRNTNFLTLQLREDIGTSNSIKFPKSKRPDHFLHNERVYTPSPATYNCSRFLQETHSEMIPRESSGINPEIALNSGRKNMVDLGKAVKGVSIPSFNSYHKSYIDHSKHRPYQPQNTEGNPGPGQYSHIEASKRANKSYSIRKVLKRFNETFSIVPGPGAYTPYRTERPSSINAKGTIPNSYLLKVPKPSKLSYLKIFRGIQLI